MHNGISLCLHHILGLHLTIWVVDLETYDLCFTKITFASIPQALKCATLDELVDQWPVDIVDDRVRVEVDNEALYLPGSIRVLRWCFQATGRCYGLRPLATSTTATRAVALLFKPPVLRAVLSGVRLAPLVPMLMILHSKVVVLALPPCARR